MPSKKTKKKLKQLSKSSGSVTTEMQENEVVMPSTESDSLLSSQSENEIVSELASDDQTEQVVQKSGQENKEVKEKQEVKKSSEKGEKEKNNKGKKEKKPSKLKQKSKEVVSELKKVIWPTPSQVVKKTATVIAVVILFSIVLLGIDTVLELVYNWFFGLFN